VPPDIDLGLHSETGDPAASKRTSSKLRQNSHAATTLISFSARARISGSAAGNMVTGLGNHQLADQGMSCQELKF
jgi:hypothetical protein